MPMKGTRFPVTLAIGLIPPMPTATATPAMLPRPTVPESAVASAWKWLTSPVSLGSE